MKQRPKTLLAAPDSKTPPLDADAAETRLHAGAGARAGLDEGLFLLSLFCEVSFPSDQVAIIPMNNIDEIRVMWSHYNGCRNLDIRVYTEIDGKTDKVPTEKGVTLRPDLIQELIKALESAQSLPEAA